MYVSLTNATDWGVFLWGLFFSGFFLGGGGVGFFVLFRFFAGLLFLF